jgi:hypothetical protein
LRLNKLSILHTFEVAKEEIYLPNFKEHEVIQQKDLSFPNSSLAGYNFSAKPYSCLCVSLCVSLCLSVSLCLCFVEEERE